MKFNIETTKIVKTSYPVNSIPSDEQETSMQKSRNQSWDICSSDQMMITKLKKNENFKVYEILISSDVENPQINDNLKILQIKGYLPPNGISLRLKSITGGDCGENNDDSEDVGGVSNE